MPPLARDRIEAFGCRARVEGKQSAEMSRHTFPRAVSAHFFGNRVSSVPKSVPFYAPETMPKSAETCEFFARGIEWSVAFPATVGRRFVDEMTYLDILIDLEWRRALAARPDWTRGYLVPHTDVKSAEHWTQRHRVQSD
jgi:hypothetical protein